MSAVLESEIVDPEWLVERIGGRAGDLADAVADLIRSGELRPGDRLPTVRALAQSTDFSVGAIVSAWGRLQEQGFVQTRRRGGTVVLPPRDTVPERGIPDWRGVDLAQNAPDLALQPSLSEALLSSLDAETLNVFGRELMTERLRDAVAQSWPFEPEAWATPAAAPRRCCWQSRLRPRPERLSPSTSPWVLEFSTHFATLASKLSGWPQTVTVRALTLSMRP
ncbi:transcriptional regulatory protein PtsJ [Rhodococcus sp. AD45]|nr:transcriptional regulatory protein PtsJ [Rhodococcus sp. AD45]